MSDMKEEKAIGCGGSDAAFSRVLEKGVWCCERMEWCKWQGLLLHAGLAWGTVPQKYPLATNDWHTAHERECGGELLQLLPQDKPSGGDLYALVDSVLRLANFYSDARLMRYGGLEIENPPDPGLAFQALRDHVITLIARLMAQYGNRHQPEGGES